MDIVVAITLFVLALLIGVEVIGKVPATLHTPLMSGANSIHGIVIAGGVIVAAVNTEVPRRKNTLARAADTRCEHVLCADFVRRHVYAAVLHVFSKCHYASSSVVSAAALLVLESA